MKKLALASVLFGIAFSGVASSAGASSPSPHYSAFGNISKGDCAWAAVANLVENRYPGSNITTRNVLTAYNADPRRENGIEALNYMQTTGFAGHRISAWGIANHQSATVKDGVVYLKVWGILDAIKTVVHTQGAAVATVDWYGSGHAVLITKATRSGARFVTWGTTYYKPWSWWQKNTGAVFSIAWA